MDPTQLYIPSLTLSSLVHFFFSDQAYIFFFTHVLLLSITNSHSLFSICFIINSPLSLFYIIVLVYGIKEILYFSPVINNNDSSK